MISTQRRREHKVFLTTKKHEETRKVFYSTFVFLRVFSWLNLSWVSTIAICLLFLSVTNSFAQTKLPTKTPAPKVKTISNLPKVTQIDAEALKNLLKPNGKPLLVNFWATWCDPCREEFPDLVQIGTDYKDKIDLITVSLDELSEINGDVPKFLAEMKSESPAYLLKTPDEGAAITAVSKDWQGGLPFTILFNEKGETVYIKQGKFKTEFLRAEIEKSLTQMTRKFPVNSFLQISETDYESGKADARKDISDGNLIIKTGGLPNQSSKLFSRILRERYGVKMQNRGCSVSSREFSYDEGYNEISKAEIKKKFGDDVLEKTRNEADELSRNKPANVINLTLKVN